MSARSYLSIGDVLSLLREEFPDVTISKIRFLESQGLVDPERSPSGYRKFYDHDVERLRWVLRQQREHFLPLKVIRDRLAAAGNGVPADEPYEGVDLADGEPADAEPADGEPAGWASGVEDARAAAVAEPVPAGVRATAVAEHATSRDPAGGNGSAGEWHGDDPSERAGNVVRLSAERAPEPREEPETALDAAPDDELAAGSSGLPFARATASDERSGGHAQHPAGQRPAKRAAPQVAAGTGDTGHVAAGPQGAVRPGAEGFAAAPGSVLSAAVSGVSLTLEELCAATGLSAADISSLEGFGLVAPMAVAGGVYYDEEALTVAKLVVDFGRFGVEPRHLRLFRNAVDREMGLIEQVITPLLRQRNPEARQRAVESAAELVRLGQGLSASLVRTELRRQLGG